jgi:hypothetical protein
MNWLNCTLRRINSDRVNTSRNKERFQRTFVEAESGKRTTIYSRHQANDCRPNEREGIGGGSVERCGMATKIFKYIIPMALDNIF